MAEPIVLGIVGIKNCGEYNSQTNYEKLNVVTYQGSTYCALQETKGNLPIDSDYWQLYAQGGAKGDTGPQGPKPVKGVDYYTEADKEELESDLASDITTEVSEQISGLVSATPLVASSTAGMIDTTRIYVNTTDGHWYWYNGTAWTDGGVYQSTGINTDGVTFNNLNDKLVGDLYAYSTDVSKLGLITINYNANSWNITSPMFIKKGTTITVSNEFVQNYHWTLRRINSLNSYTAIFNETTNTSYTLEDDEYCVFSWRPIDNNWDTEQYTVNQWQYLTSDDITSIKYYYPTKYSNHLIDLDINEIINNCLGVSPNGSTKYTYGATTRLGIARPIKSAFPIKFHITPGYQFGITTWTDANHQGKDYFVSDTGWINNDYIIPANTYFRFALKETNNTNLSYEKITDYFSMSSYGDFDYINNYIDNIIERIGDYNYSGIDLDFKVKHGYEHSLLMNTTLLTSSSQGFDIYDGKIVQLYNGGRLQILDIESGEQLADISNLGFNHGDTCQFSNTKFNDNDLFPLLYVVSDTYPAVVHILRIVSVNEAYNIKKYVLGDAAGYYSGQCFDFKRNLIYSFGYKNQDFQTSANGNKMLVTVYDMSKERLISGSDYEIELVDQFEEKFMYCLQGQKFFNGLCFLVSSYNPSVQKTKIYVYDITQRKIVALFEDFPTVINNSETEDLAFMINSDGTKYDMIISTRAVYEKLSFM